MSTSRDQMDVLLDSALNAATDFLQKRGEFYPFAVALGPDGQVIHVNAWQSDEQPDSQSLMKLLISGLQNGVGTGQYVATAIVANVNLTDRQTGQMRDAMRVQIEHEDAAPVTCFAPYRRDADGIEVGELQAVPGDQLVFKKS